MTPAQVLVAQLAAARRRGKSFEVAWPDALAAALAAVHGNAERAEWAAVLGGMVEVWRGAFERRPAGRRQRALAAVAADPDREPLPDRERVAA